MDPGVAFQSQINVKQELDFVVKCEPDQDSGTMYNTEVIKVSVDKNGCMECHHKQTQIDSLSRQVDGIAAQLLQSKAEHQAAFIQSKKGEEEIAKLQMMLQNRDSDQHHMIQMAEQTNKINAMEEKIQDISAQLARSKAECEAANTQNKDNEKEIANLRMKVGKREPDLYDVKEIVKHKKEKGKNWYFVRWDGFGPEEDSWVIEKDLSCPGILRKYKNSLKK